MRHILPSFAFAGLAIAQIAAAEELNLNTSLAFDADDARAVMASQDQPGAADPAQPVSMQPIFGQPGHWWGQIGGGYAAEAVEKDAAHDINLAFTASTFLVEDFELMLQLGGWYFDQPGDNAWGLNFNLLFRWHFLSFDTWTLFMDGGAGMLATTDLVPDGGTGFNFTPTAGGGATIKLGQSANRLVLGVRWHHISNARIEGEDRNPSRDGIMGYVAFQFPF